MNTTHPTLTAAADHLVSMLGPEWNIGLPTLRLAVRKAAEAWFPKATAGEWHEAIEALAARHNVALLS